MLLPLPLQVAKPKNKTATMVGAVVGSVGGAILVGGCAVAVIKVHAARNLKAAAAPPAFPDMSQPTSPMSPNTVAAHPFLPANHAAYNSTAHQ